MKITIEQSQKFADKCYEEKSNMFFDIKTGEGHFEPREGCIEFNSSGPVNDIDFDDTPDWAWSRFDR